MASITKVEIREGKIVQVENAIVENPHSCHGSDWSIQIAKDKTVLCYFNKSTLSGKETLLFQLKADGSAKKVECHKGVTISIPSQYAPVGTKITGCELEASSDGVLHLKSILLKGEHYNLTSVVFSNPNQPFVVRNAFYKIDGLVYDCMSSISTDGDKETISVSSGNTDNLDGYEEERTIQISNATWVVLGKEQKEPFAQCSSRTLWTDSTEWWLIR